MRNINILFILFLFFLASCNEICPEITDPVIEDNGNVVLIEELTGASCPNCPKGTAAVKAILDKFPGKVAAIGIHGKFLCEPVKNRSKYDFRNEKAKNLEEWFLPWLGKPAAAFNRIDQNSTDEKYAIFATGLWQSQVEAELQKEHVMNILMDVKYDETNHVANIDFTAIPLKDLPGEYNYSIFLTESQIIDAQTNGSVIIDDFEHNHVLRDMATNFQGDFLGNNLVKNNIIKKSIPYPFPKESIDLWNPDNMEVVIAIHPNSTTPSRVIQCAFKHLK